MIEREIERDRAQRVNGTGREMRRAETFHSNFDSFNWKNATHLITSTYVTNLNTLLLSEQAYTYTETDHQHPHQTFVLKNAYFSFRPRCCQTSKEIRFWWGAERTAKNRNSERIIFFLSFLFFANIYTVISMLLWLSLLLVLLFCCHSISFTK